MNRLDAVKSRQGKSSGRVVSLALSPSAEQVISRMKRETGITQVALLERLLEWFAAQDTRIRSMVLSPYPEVRQGLARLVLEEMEGDPAKDFDAMPKFDALIDHDFTSGPRTREGRVAGAAEGPRHKRRDAARRKP